jgi:hypothetical protein
MLDSEISKQNANLKASKNNARMAGSNVRGELECCAFRGSEMGGAKEENPKPRQLLLLGHQRAQRRSGTTSPFDPPFTSPLAQAFPMSVTPLPLRVSKLVLPSLLVSRAHQRMLSITWTTPSHTLPRSEWSGPRGSELN